MNYLEEARLSGLMLGGISSGTPQWSHTEKEEWPRDVKLPIGNALVVVYPGNHNPSKEEIVVLVGGRDNDKRLTSVLLLLKRMGDGRQGRHWQEGAPLNQGRDSLSAVVCNGHVYAIGGLTDSSFDSFLDTVERIGLLNLISSASTKSTFRDNGDTPEKKWETLKCRLSTPRRNCSAVVVRNRYILVAGGLGRLNYTMSSVDIIDTATSTDEASEQPCCIFSGPPLTVPRESFGMEIIGQRVYVVGGFRLYSVEYLDLNDFDPSTTDKKNTSSFKFWSGLSWTKHKHLKLSEYRWDHGTVRVGSCLVVSGGTFLKDGHFPGIIEILDVKRNKVWNLPHPSRFLDYNHRIIALSNGIVYIGGRAGIVYIGGRVGNSIWCETLPLMGHHSVLFRRLLEQPPWWKTTRV